MAHDIDAETQPITDFLASLGKDPAKAKKFASNPASVVDPDTTLDDVQKKALKSGCTQEVMDLFKKSKKKAKDPAAKEKIAIIWTLNADVSCKHAKCIEFQKNARK